MLNPQNHPTEIVNVGTAGGDLQARRFALALTGTLTILALPPLDIPDSTLKIAAIAVAMSGTLLLMAGLVFLQKTQSAGVILLPAAGLILLAAQGGSRLAAAAIGVAFCMALVVNLLSCSCPLNRAFGINSCPSKKRRAALEPARQN